MVFPDLPTLGILGLGYVGLPLAVAFGRRFETWGFDRAPGRIGELSRGFDRTGEVAEEALREAGLLRLTADARALADCDVYIITVPTPVDAHKRPDL
ncbi:MAG: Vi polysaccharide biosynthesis UDP-N-acetylglucosamine C-6 dehydrogenase TviB, partial [Gammaproteobacteria bacterium]